MGGGGPTLRPGHGPRRAVRRPGRPASAPGRRRPSPAPQRREAAATGRWQDANRFGRLAQDIHARQEGYEGAVALELALQVSIGIHIGFEPAVLTDYDRLDLGRATAYTNDTRSCSRCFPWSRSGATIKPGACMAALCPWRSGNPPAFLWLPIHVFRLLAAIALGQLDDVPPLMDQLRSSRGFHVAGGGGRSRTSAASSST